MKRLRENEGEWKERKGGVESRKKRDGEKHELTDGFQEEEKPRAT